jgi:MOSC N-terminal beta barrel domain
VVRLVRSPITIRRCTTLADLGTRLLRRKMAISSLGLDFVPRLQLSDPAALALIFTTCVGPVVVLLLFEHLTRRSQQLAPTGCRKLGLRAKSNLADQYDRKYVDGGPPESHQWKVKSLWIYPVKSCKGIELNRGSVLGTGMQYDRQFSFAQLKSPFPVVQDSPESEKSAHQWEFITQRQFPLLARVRTELWVPDPSSETYSPQASGVLSGGYLVITFPYVPDGWRGFCSRLSAALVGGEPELSFMVPFSPTPEISAKKGYTVETMKIWRDSPMALDMSIDLPPELKYFLGVRNPMALFRVIQGKERQVFRCAPRKGELGWQPAVGFADSVSLHSIAVLSEDMFNPPW